MMYKSQNRPRGRPFVKGQSGNPAGRRPGCRNRATLAAEQLLDGEAEALVRKAVELALAGDPVRARTALRKAPPLMARCSMASTSRQEAAVPTSGHPYSDGRTMRYGPPRHASRKRDATPARNSAADSLQMQRHGCREVQLPIAASGSAAARGFRAGGAIPL
jgi:hypothetical protein